MTQTRLWEKEMFSLLDLGHRTGERRLEQFVAKAGLLSCGLEAVHHGQLHSV